MKLSRFPCFEISYRYFSILLRKINKSITCNVRVCAFKLLITPESNGCTREVRFGGKYFTFTWIRQVPASMIWTGGRNISLCCMISSGAVEKFELTEGSYNRELFMVFLVSCSNIGLFQNNAVLIMNNVRFHHCKEIKDYLQLEDVTVMYLPPYSPDLNPIENVFSCIISRLNSIRPRSGNQEKPIGRVITWVGNFTEYYQKFWIIVNAINNRQVK